MDGYIEVTNELFSSIKLIEDNKVVQSQYFDLFEGARATEVTNPKLDTGIIPLTKVEIDFDCYASLSGQQLIGITNKLLRLVMSWLDNSLLPVTVLSCRYVQELLQHYSSSKVLIKFGDDALSTILTSVVTAICKFIGIMVTVGNTVLYEEEDITTRAMDLNLLTEVLIEDIVSMVEHSITLVKTINLSPQDERILTNQLLVILNFNKLPILFNLRIELFKAHNYEFFNTVLKQGKDNVKFLQTIPSWSQYEQQIPEGCFSRYIQRKLDNRNIPGELYSIDQNESIDQYVEVLEQIEVIFDKLTHLNSFGEFLDFLQYDIKLQISKFHIITRGFFQLYLIRDDQLILGSTTLNINWMTLKMFEFTNLFNTVYFTRNWNLPQATVSKVETKFEELTKEIETFTYQLLALNGNNRCRQRQLINKNLLILDSLQVSCENYELELFRTHKINDRLNDTNDLSLPLTSYVYYQKLYFMLDYLLVGIELDLYKLFEMYSIYWYCEYILKNLLDHYETRILAFNTYKLAKLTIKKKKVTGATKAEIENKRQFLILVIEYNQQQLSYFKLLHGVINAMVHLLHYYHAQVGNNIDFKSVPTDFLVSFENLYRLRFKSFDSIGVPSSLTFANYNTSLDGTSDNLATIIQRFETSSSELGKYNHQVKNTSFKAIINSLMQTCIMYIVHLKKYSQTQDTIEVSKGFNLFFPKIG